MAVRRMFAKTIVQSSRFLKMPVSSRELYFQMGMAADDDGVVEAWNVMKLTNAREDDLRVLVSKGYVQILDNEDMIAYLTDWSTNNTIRKDRYQEGIYKDLKLRVLDAAVNQLTTTCQPSDNQTATEFSIGKDSIEKLSIEEDILSENNTDNHREDISRVIDYLNDVLGTRYTTKSKSTTQKIKARLDEGHTFEDFRTVIDKKYREWGSDSKMVKYLRPETLFSAGHFESYLNEIEATPKTGTINDWLNA